MDASYFMGPQIWHPSSSYTYALTNYSSSDFKSEYTYRYGEVPVYQGAAAFALPFILLDAITKAGTWCSSAKNFFTFFHASTLRHSKCKNINHSHCKRFN